MQNLRQRIREAKERRAHTAAARRPDVRPAPASRWAVVPLVLVVIGIIAVAFRGSWGAMRDAALACHFDRDSATLYPFAVDGLLVVAILAAVLLRHDRGARWYTLGIIAGYTAASWLINFLHGLGTFSINPVTHTRPVPPWPVVIVVASLVIGSIFLGSHLLVYVWRHLFPDAAPEQQPAEVYQAGTDVDQDVPDVLAPPVSSFEVAKAAYRHSLPEQYKTLTQVDLMNRYRLNKREAGRVQSEVKAELDAGSAVTEWARDVAEHLGQSPNGQHASTP